MNNNVNIIEANNDIQNKLFPCLANAKQAINTLVELQEKYNINLKDVPGIHNLLSVTKNNLIKTVNEPHHESLAGIYTEVGVLASRLVLIENYIITVPHEIHLKNNIINFQTESDQILSAVESFYKNNKVITPDIQNKIQSLRFHSNTVITKLCEQYLKFVRLRALIKDCSSCNSSKTDSLNKIKEIKKIKEEMEKNVIINNDKNGVFYNINNLIIPTLTNIINGSSGFSNNDQIEVFESLQSQFKNTIDEILRSTFEEIKKCEQNNSLINQFQINNQPGINYNQSANMIFNQNQGNNPPINIFSNNQFNNFMNNIYNNSFNNQPNQFLNFTQNFPINPNMNYTSNQMGNNNMIINPGFNLMNQNNQMVNSNMMPPMGMSCGNMNNQFNGFGQQPMQNIYPNNFSI